MITTFYPPHSFGGDAIFVEALSRGLVERGHEVEVVHCLDSYRALAPAAPSSDVRRQAEGTLSGGSREPDDRALRGSHGAAGQPRDAGPLPAASPPGLRVHALHSRFGILSPLATHQTGRPLFKGGALRRLLAARRFDVIHHHNISLVGGPAVLRYGTALKLYTLHEHWLLCPMHTLFRDNRELCTGKRCISCALRYSRPPQLWRYGRLLERSVAAVDSFIAPTEFTRRLHLASGLPLRIEVLGSFHQPADAKPTAPAETDASETAPGAAPGRPYFLYAGRLERLKGVAALIAAFRADGEAELLIAGTGSEEGTLREQAAGCGNIRFLGSVPRDRLTRLFAGALAVLVPSLAYEVFPLVILEAFAQGTPVLARDRGPLAEIVSTSGGGLLFADAAGLAGGLRRLRQEPGLRQALGAAGRRAWLSRWTLAAHLDGYFDLIRRLRSGGRGAAGASAASPGARVAAADAADAEGARAAGGGAEGARVADADAEGERAAGGGAEGARAASTEAAGAPAPPTVSVAPQEAAGARGAVEAAGPP